jgi:7-keto-8-aminopelargonate synthetase-like enzyme
LVIYQGLPIDNKLRILCIFRYFSNHASLIDANHLIGLPLQRYLHNDMIALEKKIAKQSGQGLIATDTVFSMDGDRADIKGIAI